MRRGTLMGAPFDLAHLEATGGAVALIANVMQAANELTETLDTGAGQFSVSASGALLYLPGGILPDPDRSLDWVDRTTGAVQPLPLPTKPYRPTAGKWSSGRRETGTSGSTISRSAR